MPEIIINIPDNIYRELLERAAKAGYKDPGEYLLHLILSSISTPQTLDLGKYVEDLVAKHVSRAERKLSDVINAYTSKIEEVASRVASLVEEMEDIKSRIDDLEGRTQEVREERGQAIQRRREQRKATAIEILKQQKVFYESSIVGKIKDRDKFFQRLENEGAVIIATDRERIAVDSDFWNEFSEKVSRIRSDTGEAIRSVLRDRKELELFERLKDSALIVFDATEKKWKILTS
ncbi:MAG: hypothetical protein QXI22_02350 [Sulfolobales archaeon]